uniref:Uncharacterized protein n=1 Tax=Arundo donax TaxID=35708 RepID=A0A0A9BVI7_ARUDO
MCIEETSCPSMKSLYSIYAVREDQYNSSNTIYHSYMVLDGSCT